MRPGLPDSAVSPIRKASDRQPQDFGLGRVNLARSRNDDQGVRVDKLNAAVTGVESLAIFKDNSRGRFGEGCPLWRVRADQIGVSEGHPGWQ